MSTNTEQKTGALHLRLMDNEEQYSDMLAYLLYYNKDNEHYTTDVLGALEDGLEDFAGCAVVITHDRWFLDRVATHILAFEGDSQVVFFEGSYSEYEENKRKRLGDTDPHRIKYRKLME